MAASIIFFNISLFLSTGFFYIFVDGANIDVEALVYKSVDQTTTK